jgi:peptidyl-dipeptidase Dcp
VKITKITIITLFSVLTMNAQESKNPFLSKYTTPYGVPPFNEIKNEHFQPAIEQGIQEHESEIVKIANNSAIPTFENTILAMENSGEILNRVTTVLNNLNSANTNDDLQKTAKDVAPNLASHHDNI